MFTSTDIRPLTQNTGYRKYEVDSRFSHLEIYDIVTPETIIGWHYKSGQPVRAGIHGHIASVYFNLMNSSLMVLAVSASNSQMDKLGWEM